MTFQRPKVLVLAWEFPPRIVGGIARHVAELYPELVNLGYEIHLVTVEFGQTPAYEQVEGIHLHRVAVKSSQDFFEWIRHMNASMAQTGGALLQQMNFALIHAHDWLVAEAAIALKHQFKRPLIVTIHATEHGRHGGLHNPTQHYVHNQEAKLVAESWRTIVCSEYMRFEVQRTLGAPWDKLDVIYNGIRAEKKPPLDPDQARSFRQRFAGDREKIVYYVGRMTPEKGVSVLLDAAPQVLAQIEAKFVVIGGGNTDSLKAQAQDHGIGEQCYFTGFMADHELDQFQTIADCAVFPSLYEPFGIVALESFAARVPVVVSNSGGLAEVVHHNRTGIITWANQADSLAWGILNVLQNPGHAAWLVSNAYEDLEQRFHWPKLAMQTQRVYQQVLQARSQVDW
jgi:glycosyltransferase involved in cell wall biosynthesis